ncbi:alpha-2-macroglobulin-like protein 1 [Siphateles boraxobius]|uniref:alpha-2-macroglobulin-like protein 1 n=1 Tax=Siphateles boraxobius TaxID=180520 RepID=UPI0040641B34
MEASPPPRLCVRCSSVQLGRSSTVTVQSSVVGGDSYSFNVNRDNRLLYQEKRLKNVPGKYSVKASGSSCVSVQVACFYNIPTPVKVSTTLRVEAKVTRDCQPLGASLMLKFTSRYDGVKSSTNMVLVDIKLLSGFTADTSLLGSSPQSFAPLVERVDAEEDRVLVYLKESRLFTGFITSGHFLMCCCSSFLSRRFPKASP